MLRLTLLLVCLQFIFSSYAQASTLNAELQVLEVHKINERTRDYLVNSEYLFEPLMIRLTLPSSYETEIFKRYPVIYLLHGGAADHTQWTELGIEEASDNKDVILVQPFGGRGTWYRNAHYASFNSQVTWESFFIQNLIPWIDNNFRTHASEKQRAIVGLSMGGYGATVIAARFPEYFTSVSSFSGAVDISAWLVACWIGVSPFIDGRLPFTIFGLYPFDEEARLQNNPFTLAENLKDKHLAFYFGNGNKGELDEFSFFNFPYRFMGWLQEKEVHDMNVAMHKKLSALNIEHDYKPYGNGMHASAYWARSLKEELPIIMGVFEKNTALTSVQILDK